MCHNFQKRSYFSDTFFRLWGTACNQIIMKMGLSHLKSFCSRYHGLISSKTVTFSTAQCQMATTKEECEALAIQLGLSDTISGDTTNNFKVPSRCYYKPNGPADEKLWFNTANVTENTSPCTQDRICVCKNGLTPFPEGYLNNSTGE